MLEHLGRNVAAVQLGENQHVGLPGHQTRPHLPIRQVVDQGRIKLHLSIHRNLIALSNATKRSETLAEALKLRNITLDAALNNMNRAMADLAAVQAGEHVLDAGCGMGSACFWLAEHRQAQATGISIVPEQIADCQRVLAQRPTTGVHFVVADYCHTPFPDAHFDVVWACESLCHAEHKIDFYREAYRLLKPGGRLVIAEYIRADRPVSERGETLLQQWLHPWAIRDIDTRAEHLAHAQLAGFQSADMQDVTRHVRVSLRNLHELCTQWLPWGKVFKAFRRFHQHFTRAFFVRKCFFCQNLTREKLREALLYVKRHCKMLMKLTQAFQSFSIFHQSIFA
jgi:ubiquinone/menaquinone biosynthesis C-methylase UbiE